MDRHIWDGLEWIVIEIGETKKVKCLNSGYIAYHSCPHGALHIDYEGTKRKKHIFTSGGVLVNSFS